MAQQKTIEIIEEHERGFLLIKRRFHYLENIQNELFNTTKGRMYEIRGDVVNQMLRDSYHMLVIDLASIARSMVKKGGFFLKIQSKNSELKKPTLAAVQKSMSTGSNANDTYLINSVLKYTTKSYERLFPLAVAEGRDIPNENDFEKLKDHFYGIFEEVIHDRDKNRAHRFEKDSRNKKKQPYMSLERLEEKFKEIEAILNDFRMVHTFGQYSSTDTNFSNSERTAQTIVDMILIGSRDYIEHCFGINSDLHNGKGIGKYTYMYRGSYYEKLWAHHEANIQKMHTKAAEKMRSQGNYDDLGIYELPLNFSLYMDKDFDE